MLCYSAGPTTPCQLDVHLCQVPGPPGIECLTCSDCSDNNSPFGGVCEPVECRFYCAGGYGNCYYTPSILQDDCSDCSDLDLDGCGDYENEFDCEENICATNVANQNMLGKICEWIGGECRENLDCTWDCSSLYDEDGEDGIVDGLCTKTGDCYPDPNVPNDPECINPANNYPNQIFCGEVEEDFPIFTNLNILLSIFLLIGYYAIILRKRRL